jgi:hypothetical protein
MANAEAEAVDDMITIATCSLRSVTQRRPHLARVVTMTGIHGLKGP